MLFKILQHAPLADHNQYTRTDTSASQYIVTFLTNQVLFTQVHLDTKGQFHLQVYLNGIYSRHTNNFTCFLNYSSKTAR